MVTKTLHCPTYSQLNEASHHRLVFTVRGDRGVCNGHSNTSCCRPYSNSHYSHNSDRLAIDKQDLMNLVSEFYLLSSITHQD
jgi:hypothetical protein